MPKSKKVSDKTNTEIKTVLNNLIKKNGGAPTSVCKELSKKAKVSFVTLYNIAQFINSISDFQSKIELQSHSYDHYIGPQKNLPIETLGLEEGIKRTFEKIKNNVV